MRIGFAVDSEGDADVLLKQGCDRIYSKADGVVVFRQLFRFLRPDDVVVVSRLARLGNEPADCISAVAQLHDAGVRLHVIGTEIEPNAEFGNAFLRACSLIVEQLPGDQKADRKFGGRRSRGRPPLIGPAVKAQIEELLQDNSTSVSQISKLLNISPATIYRHFPRDAQIVAQRNIEHYRKQLLEETDSAKHEALARLLAEEEAKLASLRGKQRQRN